MKNIAVTISVTPEELKALNVLIVNTIDSLLNIVSTQDLERHNNSKLLEIFYHLKRELERVTVVGGEE